MTVFLDTSTILAACWSAKGLSRLLIEYAHKTDWRLITADYCISEVEKNVRKHLAGAVDWNRIVRDRLEVVGSVYVIDRPIVFDATKDRPVILSAIGSNSDYLVTSDTTDFAHSRNRSLRCKGAHPQVVPPRDEGCGIAFRRHGRAARPSLFW